VLVLPGFTGLHGPAVILAQPKAAGETVCRGCVPGAGRCPVVCQVAKTQGVAAGVGVVPVGGRECGLMRSRNWALDVCLDHKREMTSAEQLAEACLRAIDIYFEMSAQESLTPVSPLAQTPISPYSGSAAYPPRYNATELPPRPGIVPTVDELMLSSAYSYAGLIIFDNYARHYPEFLYVMTTLVAECKVKVQGGIQVRAWKKASSCLYGACRWKATNFGKLVVKIAEVA